MSLVKMNKQKPKQHITQGGEHKIEDYIVYWMYRDLVKMNKQKSKRVTQGGEQKIEDYIVLGDHTRGIPRPYNELLDYSLHNVI